MTKPLTLIALSLLTGLASVNAASMDRYAYDELGRLTAVRNAEDVSTEAYRYDGVGNIVEKTIEGETYRLAYDNAHQLKSAEGPDGLRQFVYDQAGRLKSEVLNGQPVVNYTYGYLDKVIAVERNGEVTRFDYDAQGMLVGKQLPDGSYERWTWDGMGLVARGEERYINEGHITSGLPLVSQTSEGVHYHQHDHLGTTVASYSTDGAVTASYDATVFGKGELEDSRTARFTGKPYDADLGAYVFPFRNYDPEAARWMSADPAGFPDGPKQHYYAPVPTMGVDPLGLWQARWTPVSNMHGTVEAYETGGGYEQVDVLDGNDTSWGWGSFTYSSGTTTGNSISGSSSMLTNHSNWGEDYLQSSGEVEYSLELMADDSTELGKTFRIELDGTLRVDAASTASLNNGAATGLKIGWISGQTQFLNLNSSNGSQIQNQVSLSGDWDPQLAVGQWTSVGTVLGSHAWQQLAGGTAGAFFDFTSTVSEL